MAQMQSGKPARKVTAGALVGAVVTILTWVLSLLKVDVPAYVALAISTLLTFIVSYLVPPAPDDQVV